ncbi:MAG: S-adenosylmethionine:tRNA ribosyltransferase-isomerase [Polyangiaceae bacterium]|nr:S-adenosylmethionine:tRNA ribosyltransferase-isomerase [Polyangiaceae bacterium]
MNAQMNAASAPRPKSEDRLLVVDAATRALTDARFDDFARFLRDDDVVVVNDAAAFPASIGFTTAGKRAELRILRGGDPSLVDAVVLGEGDRLVRTEDRGEPPALVEGDSVTLDGGIEALVVAVDPRSPRLLKVRLKGDVARATIGFYREGRPVQYAYVPTALALWDVQTPYAGRPWASEMPSAGRPLSWRILGAIRSRGIEVLRVTHGAGLSSTGDAALDERLPLPERYAIDVEAARSINTAKASGRRIVAIGTSVVRALEASARSTGRVEPGSAVTDLIVGPETKRAVVDAVLTGMHEIGTSHFSLLEAFAERELVTQAVEHGAREGYLLHEFGDSMLVVAREKRGILPRAA